MYILCVFQRLVSALGMFWIVSRVVSAHACCSEGKLDPCCPSRCFRCVLCQESCAIRSNVFHMHIFCFAVKDMENTLVNCIDGGV